MIDNGSEADPLQVEGGYTPLQAAALMGRLDVFEILLDHGAKDREPQLGKPNALQLAQNGKHSSIIERLSNPT
jgi:ankyrin repeat protein